MEQFRKRYSSMLDHPLIATKYSYTIRRNKRVLAAATFVDEHICDSIRLADVAGSVFMDRCAFSRFFKAKVGITFATYVRIVRVARASDLIAHDDAMVSDACREAGFGSMGALLRAFRAVYGETPSEYRARALDVCKYLPFVCTGAGQS